ncbi:hypothetical protein ACFCV9_10870 [Streptomyces sp. NPDC056367]|uniref:DUF6924 domain-containing protein n=1 Tax=Streptomyces sp. NPDC056367 TaxID=3345797 RepID=UPI0035DFA551
MTTLLVRTDFTQPHAWQTLLTTVQTPNSHGFLAETVTIDDPAYRDLPPEHVLERLPADQQDRLVALADTTTLTHDELPILVIDRSEEPPQHLRVTADQLWSIDNNLTLGNMDYEEFTEAAHDDGVFRGF